MWETSYLRRMGYDYSGLILNHQQPYLQNYFASKNKPSFGLPNIQLTTQIYLLYSTNKQTLQLVKFYKY